MINKVSVTHAELTHPKYRADIDGLRAIAVLSVVSFHALPEWIKGGFIGVDVFFVISGFLISTIIFENLQSDSFSFSLFYSRRIKRIFPALIIVLATCLFFGWLSLLPAEYKQLGKHVASGAGFISNFILLHESGYFDSLADTKPLLHLWSLGIEEQFYIFWPLLLWAAWRKKINWLVMTAAIAVISFALNVLTIHTYPTATFYLPLTRFWELLIGSLLAYFSLYKRNSLTTRYHCLANHIERIAKINLPRGIAIENTLGLFGATALILGLLLINQKTPFPGAWALLPTVGGAFIIAAGPRCWINRIILSNRLLVWFGLISYSLYLWHWPILSFARIIEGGTPSIAIRICLILLSIALAWLSFQFIEKPIRQGKLGKGNAIPVLLILMFIVFLIGLGVDKKYIAPRSQKIMALPYLEFGGYPTPKEERLNKQYNFGVLGHNEKNKIVLLGDSHSQQYRNTFATLIATHPSVEVMYSLDYLTPNAILGVSKKLIFDDSIKIVIFSNFWALDYGSDKINYAVRCCGNALGGSVGGNPYQPPSTAKQMGEVDRVLKDASLALTQSGKKVYFVLDNPFGEELAPKNLVKRSIIDGVHIQITPLTTSKALLRDEPMRSRILEIARKTGASVIDPYESLCNTEDCPALSQDGTPIYKDYDHLSFYAVTHLVRYFDFLMGK